ncbi:TOM1-like protein 8 [Impatiens glandulifera]|uniref:TOM1-like protein 8 n=1 Tax=Impatiens glandulifera TaxID=253017 RepID=UPI001FB12E64|nr:TOM1-like protein 8 [Impatiens glandulifera]
MVNSLVDRATSDHLSGPDWGKNLEISDICNRDATQAKEAIKGIKKRLQSKSSKVQLLTLILLDTLVKNCGDVIHANVVDKDLLCDMVKMAKKKPDFRVKEKILILIDTWQEALGGARAKHSQFYASYLDLLRTGIVFPQRSEKAPSLIKPNKQNGESSSPSEDEFPILSSTEIQNARGIMDVLAEMLNVLEPKNKEDLGQDVITDLVSQCRTYKQRVVHLVNSTSDELLLRQGLALNDELQRLLAKYEAIASGNIPVERPKEKPERPKEKSDKTVVVEEVDSLLIDTGDTSKHSHRSNSDPAQTVAANVTQKTPIKIDPKMDLLSFDDYTPPSEENSLAIVTAGTPQPNTPMASSQNSLALVEMFPTGGSGGNNHQYASSVGQEYPSTSQYQQQQQQQRQRNYQSCQYEQQPFPMFPQYDQQQQSLYMQGANNNPVWNGQIPQPSSPMYGQPSSPMYGQPASPAYGSHTNCSFPPPPWETQSMDSDQPLSPPYHPTVQVTQVIITSSHPMSNQGNQQVIVTQSHPMPNQGSPRGANEHNMMYPPPTMNLGLPAPPTIQTYSSPQIIQTGQTSYGYGSGNQNQQQQMYSNQAAGGYGYGYGYGYGQQQNTPLVENRMSSLSIKDDSVYRSSSYSSPTPSYVTPKTANIEDKLFGDLIDLTKFKPGKATHGKAESM